MQRVRQTNQNEINNKIWILKMWCLTYIKVIVQECSRYGMNSPKSCLFLFLFIHDLIPLGQHTTICSNPRSYCPDRPISVGNKCCWTLGKSFDTSTTVKRLELKFFHAPNVFTIRISCCNMGLVRVPVIVSIIYWFRLGY